MKDLKTAITLLAPIAVFIFDRGLKWLFIHSWSEVIFPLGQWLSLRLAFNSGVAFGLPVNYWLIIILYLLAFGALSYYGLILFCRKNSGQLLSLLLVWVGAWSNFLDRLYYARVIDYIDVRYFSIFNLADCAIVGGLIFLVWSAYRQEAE